MTEPAYRNKILFIDDNPILSDMVGKKLTDAGYEVELAASGTDGLRRAQGYMPDLIILDIMMPVMDGHETLRRLKASPDSRVREIPVVIFSARREKADIITARKEGAKDYITKPVNITTLLERVKMCMPD